MAISLHLFFILALFIVICRNLYIVIGAQDFVTTYKKLQMITPIYHTINACIIFTGVVVQFFLLQFTDFTVYLMFFASIFIMVSEIKRYKKMRIIKSKEHEKQQEAYKFAKKVYVINISIIIIIYLIEKFI
jgi:uncharacterized membrane protein